MLEQIMKIDRKAAWICLGLWLQICLAHALGHPAVFNFVLLRVVSACCLSLESQAPNPWGCGSTIRVLANRMLKYYRIS